MANYSFFTDVTGKKIRISDVQSNIPCYISSSNAAVKIGSSTSYVVTASNGIAEAPLSFSPLQEASKEITVTAYGKYSNGVKTNDVQTTIMLKNALQGLIVAPDKTELYTGENTIVHISAPNTTYGWNNNANVTLSTAPISCEFSHGQTELSPVFVAPSVLNSVSSMNIGITASTTAGQYSANPKSGNRSILVKQAATGISYTVPTIYVGETKKFTCPVTPSNVYSKMVTIKSGGTTEYYSASAITPTSDDTTTISISGKKAGSSILTLQSKDGKVTKDVRITITAKTKASLSLSKTNTTLNPNQIDPIRITNSGCTISASNINSSNSAIAIAELSGSYLNITARSAGTTTITVSGKPNTGYTAPDSKTIDVTVKNISISVVG